MDRTVYKTSQSGGHVVVKAYDGGTKFKVYYLAANDESMTVKAVYGPWNC